MVKQNNWKQFIMTKTPRMSERTKKRFGRKVFTQTDCG